MVLIWEGENERPFTVLHCLLVPPALVKRAKPNYYRCWKLGDEVEFVSKLLEPCLSEEAFGAHKQLSAHLPFQSQCLSVYSAQARPSTSSKRVIFHTFPSPTSASITYLFCHCVCYKLDSSSLSLMSPCWKCYECGVLTRTGWLTTDQVHNILILYLFKGVFFLI